MYLLRSVWPSVSDCVISLACGRYCRSRWLKFWGGHLYFF